jgi:acyl-CoA thioesterase FadM
MLSYTAKLYGTAIRELLRGRIHWTRPVEQHFRAWPWNCDNNFHINNARYFFFMDLGRTAWLTRAGLMWPAVTRGAQFMLAGQTITFRRSLDWWRPFTLKTRLMAWDERWFYFEQTFYRHDGQVAARALVRGTAKLKGKTWGIDEMLALIGEKAPQPQWTPELRAWVDAMGHSLQEIRSAA